MAPIVRAESRALAGLAAPTYTPNRRCLLKPWLDDASPLADAIRRGEIRSAEAVEASLEAIANSKLNALTFLDAEGARRQAEQIDARIARGEDAGLLSGVPILVKDVEDADGWPTTHGSLVFKENIAAEDSTHVARLRAAGAVLVGKAATSEFGFVAYTSTKLHGVTRNPWNLERTPAGSSGGSAAAVAGGLVPAATAGDGGGSIRLPASHCGLGGRARRPQARRHRGQRSRKRHHLGQRRSPLPRRCPPGLLARLRAGSHRRDRLRDASRPPLPCQARRPPREVPSRDERSDGRALREDRHRSLRNKPHGTVQCGGPDA